MVNSWDFSGSAKWYDIILGIEEYEKNADFVSSQLKKFKVKKVLELACGSGLYLHPLKNKGFDVEGLDISEEMIKVAKKRCKSVKMYNQDMTKFKINKKYDAILILNSGLALLPNYSLIEKTIKLCQEHLNKKGILMIDVSNHEKEIKESNFNQTHEEYITSNEKINVIFKDYKKKDKWITEWHGFVKRGNKFLQFKEYFEELIYSPKKLEKCLENEGFKILNIFGSRRGKKFDSNKSWRRFYLCQKH